MMQFKKIAVLAIACLGFGSNAQANEVKLTTNQPLDIIYRVAHKNQGGQIIFSGDQSVNVSKSISIPINLNNYDLTGVVIVKINGHALPSSINQFDKPQQCSMTTDKSRTIGALDLAITKKELKCKTQGGVYG